MASKLLSKTKYLNGLQCAKLLWMYCNRPDTFPPVDMATQYVFDQGHLVGELAKRLFPEGINIPTDDFIGNINLTRKLLGERKTLFEVGLMAGRLYSRVDVLKPAGQDSWDIIEVKSSASIKEINVHDVAFQKKVCATEGLKINRCYLAYINTGYVKHGEIDPHQLLRVEDITGVVQDASADIEERIIRMFEIIDAANPPERPIGKHCLAPYECALRQACWEFLPENSIFDLRGGKATQFSLYEKGILKIEDIPEEFMLNHQQQIQKGCLEDGSVHIEHEEIRQFLQKLEYPLYYLDFETISPAVPLYDGTHPYQDIPFQFSLHIVENEGCVPQHYSHLAEGACDPRPELLKRLQQLSGSRGSIIAYNASFETGVLTDLVKILPEYEPWLTGILGRIVDLLKPFSHFHYYNTSQKDSASLKKVLPAVTGIEYTDMPVCNGTDASVLFYKLITGATSPEEAVAIRQGLLDYCKLDTEGMVKIVKKLKEMACYNG
ncbi:MAG: DUF2779 domain-containing protein [Dehalococcoidaceae bacterium]|nr:DUF2779 domain-containing protein [Dehalococcoidaceae bacterium]